MISFDTNLLFAAMEATAPRHKEARGFIESLSNLDDVVLCELVLVEWYLLLRNPAVVAHPVTARDAVRLVQSLRQHPKWRLVENAPVMDATWARAGRDPFARRRLIELRLAYTLQHHGVTDFATVNVADFKDTGFHRVWNPLE